MKTEEYTDILTLVAGFIVCKRRDLARVVGRNIKLIIINRIYKSNICMHQAYVHITVPCIYTI